MKTALTRRVRDSSQLPSFSVGCFRQEINKSRKMLGEGATLHVISIPHAAVDRHLQEIPCIETAVSGSLGITSLNEFCQMNTGQHTSHGDGTSCRVLVRFAALKVELESNGTTRRAAHDVTQRQEQNSHTISTVERGTVVISEQRLYPICPRSNLQQRAPRGSAAAEHFPAVAGARTEGRLARSTQRRYTCT